MAEIYLAKDTRSEEVVVIKRILPYLAEEPEFVQMFLDEARIVSQIHHPNVVSLLELGKLEGSIFIAMEWVDGADLRKVVTEHGAVLPWRFGAYIVARLCEGLNSAHARTGPDGGKLGIVHRDVSPQNLMISYDGEIKLVDFGIAKATAWVSRSKPGFIKGKFLYLSPEQLTQEPIDSRSDIFAVGSLLYEITTGRSAFHRASTEAIIYAIRREPPAPPSSVIPGYPPELARIVLKCLEKDRSKRFQTCEDVRRALDGFLYKSAPTDRADIARLMSTLFGDRHERTIIEVPSKPAPPLATPVTRATEVVRTDRVRPNPQNDNAMTAEQLPAVSDRLREAARKGESISLGGLESAPTKVDSPRRNSSADIEEGLAEFSGGDDEHTVPMSDVKHRVAQLAPFSEHELTPSIPSEPSTNKLPLQEAPGDEPTGRTPVIVRPSYVQLSAAAEPRKPRPAPMVIEDPDDQLETADQRANPVVDADDHIDTEDQRAAPVSSPGRPVFDPLDDDHLSAETGAAPQQSSAKTAAVVAIGLLAFVLAAVITFAVWPHLNDAPTFVPPPTPSLPKPTEGTKPPETPPQPAAPLQVQVKFQAKKGTTIELGNVVINPGEQRAMTPGRVQVRFTCPAAKRGQRRKTSVLSFDIPADPTHMQLVEAPCK